jgi:hypothetical protein
MSLHELQPRRADPSADKRQARMRRRLREVSRRASRAERNRRAGGHGGALLALALVCATSIGAAVLALAQTLLTPLFWP